MYFIYCGHSTCVVVFSHGKYCCESFLCHFAFSSFYSPFHSSPLNCYHRIAARPSSSICVPFKNAISICPLHTILLLTEVKKRREKKNELLIVWLLGRTRPKLPVNHWERECIWCQLANTLKSYCISMYIALFKLD